MDEFLGGVEGFKEGKETQPKKLRGPIKLLRDAWAIYRGRFRMFFAILGIPVGYAIVYSLIFYFLSHTNFAYSFFFSLFHFLLGVALVILFLCSLPALIYSFKGETDIREAYKRGWALILPSIWVLFLLASLIIGGLVFAVIPAIVFGVWFSLALFTFVFEGIRGFSALGRSRQLVKGRFWGVFGRILLMKILLGIIFFGVIVALTWNIDYFPLSGLVASIAGYLLQILILPLFLLYLYLIYEDLRKIKAEEPYMAPSSRLKVASFLPGLVGGASVCFVVLWVSFAIFYEWDIPLIDDSDLRLSKVAIPKEANAYYDFEEAIKKRFLPRRHFPPAPGETDWDSVYNDMLEGKRLRTREADELIRRNKELFEHFERGLRRPVFQLPYIENPEDLGPDTLLPELSHLRDLARWGRIKANYLFARGEEREAFEWLLKVVKLGKMVEESPRPAGIIQYIVAETISQIGREGLRKLMAKTTLPGDVLMGYKKEFERLVVGDEEGLKRAIKMDYMALNKVLQMVKKNLYEKSRMQIAVLVCILGNPDEIWPDVLDTVIFTKVEDVGVPRMPHFLPKRLEFYYKQQKTRLTLAEYQRFLLRDLGKIYKDMEIKKFLERETGRDKWGKIKNVLTDNIIGKSIVYTWAKSVITPMLERSCLERFNREATACLFALRAYQKDNGHLPSSLEELVPRYLSKVPIDPFDGKPLRYSRQKRIIYCVGTDLVDNGGSVGEKVHWTESKDPTIEIGF